MKIPPRKQRLQWNLKIYPLEKGETSTNHPFVGVPWLVFGGVQLYSLGVFNGAAMLQVLRAKEMLVQQTRREAAKKLGRWDGGREDENATVGPGLLEDPQTFAFPFVIWSFEF